MEIKTELFFHIVKYIQINWIVNKERKNRAQTFHSPVFDWMKSDLNEHVIREKSV